MKKIPKMTIAFMMIFTIVASYFMPLMSVAADDGYVLYFETTANHTIENDNGHLKIDGQYVELRDSNNSTIGTVSCDNERICKIVVTDNIGGNLNYNADSKFTLFMQGHPVDINHNFMYSETIMVEDYSEEENHQEEGYHFDGRAVVVWSCGEGTCYHYFSDIPNFDDGNSTFLKASSIKADNDQSKSFDVYAQYKAWVLPERFNYWQEVYKNQNNLQSINWSEVDPEDIISEYPPNMGEWEQLAISEYQKDHTKGCVRPNEGDSREKWEEFEYCVDEYYIAAGNLPFIRLQPVGEPQYNNAYVSYGDRNFKVVIYNDKYKGVSMGNLNELNYYPSQWTNPFIKRDQFDISGTTKDNPALMDSILLEDTVMIKPLNYNAFAISKIEALDVPKDAVTITKVNNEFKLKFSSNFYDNVVFKVTDTDNEVSYIQIKRYTIDSWIKHDNNHPVLTADFYFDRTKSYNDFGLTAKIVYKDGTTKKVNLNAAFGIDDGLGNITNAYEVDEQSMGGKGLKKSSFEYRLEDGEDRNIAKVYLNAEYTGSTSTNYAGAYVGNGKGVLANIYHGEDD